MNTAKEKYLVTAITKSGEYKYFDGWFLALYDADEDQLGDHSSEAAQLTWCESHHDGFDYGTGKKAKAALQAVLTVLRKDKDCPFECVMVRRIIIQEACSDLCMEQLG